MHSLMSNVFDPVGRQRFLPWHRVYTLKMEDLLRSKKPNLMIPYWNFAEDKQRPDWVWKPPQVVRDTPGANPIDKGSLPSKADVDDMVKNRIAYTDFSKDVEENAHNEVHMWLNGTISNPSTAAEDPIFFLLHSNVDRIWDLWQLNNHTGTPSLTGRDATMTPWTETASDANDVIKLGFSYN
jgi:hypothetical protein